MQDESAMGGQSLIYSFVANGTNVLAEYTAFSGNFSTIAIQCLQKLPANNNKFTYTCDQHTFNYLVEDGYSTFVSPSFFFCRSFCLALWSFFLFPYILWPLSSLKVVSPLLFVLTRSLAVAAVECTDEIRKKTDGIVP